MTTPLAPRDEARLRAYLDRPLDDLQEELALYAPYRDAGDALPVRIAAPVRAWLCDDWGWCRLRQDARFDDRYELGIAVAGIVLRHLDALPGEIDGLLIAAVVVKLGLDHFCGCL